LNQLKVQESGLVSDDFSVFINSAFSQKIPLYPPGETTRPHQQFLPQHPLQPLLHHPEYQNSFISEKMENLKQLNTHFLSPQQKQELSL
jgi:hypothetical protein